MDFNSTETDCAKYFHQKKPVRMCICISRKSPYREQENIDSAVEAILQQLGVSLDTMKEARWLVTEKWDRVWFFVYDFFHTNYNSQIAHLPEENQLPVIIVDSRAKFKIGMAAPPMRSRVNGDVAQAHDSHGWVEPPYIADHTGGKVPCYMFPRSLKCRDHDAGDSQD